MDIYPRADYGALARYLPDRSPIAADLSDNRNLWGAHPDALAVLAGSDTAAASEYPGSYSDRLVGAVAAQLNIGPENVTTGAGGRGCSTRSCGPSRPPPCATSTRAGPPRECSRS